MVDTAPGAPAANPNGQFPDKTFDEDRRKRASPTKTLGHGGVAIFGGFINEREKNRELVGTRKYTTFTELLANVAVVAAGARHMLGMIGKTQWTFEPAIQDDAESQRLAELCEDILGDMITPLPKVVRRAAMHKLHGFSMQEWTAKKRPDGVIGLKDVEPRAQYTIEQWDVDLSGTVHGVRQTSPYTGRSIYIPRAKVVYCVDDTFTDSPEGMGILRHVAPVAARLHRYEQLEGFGLESDLRGIPVGRAPYAALREAVEDESMTETQRKEALRPLEELIQNHIRSPALGIVLDSMVWKSTDEGGTPSSTYQYDLDLLKSEATSQEECGRAIDRLTRSLAYLLGIEGMLLGSTGEGSHALAKVKSNTFNLLVDGSNTDVAEAIKRDLLKPLFALNGWDEKFLPKPVPEKMQRASIEEMTAALRDLGAAGAPLDIEDPAIDVVRELLGLPPHETINLQLDAALNRQSLDPNFDPEAPGGAGEDDADGADGANSEGGEDDEDVADDEDVDPRKPGAKKPNAKTPARGRAGAKAPPKNPKSKKTSKPKA